MTGETSPARSRAQSSSVVSQENEIVQNNADDAGPASPEPSTELIVGLQARLKLLEKNISTFSQKKSRNRRRSRSRSTDSSRSRSVSVSKRPFRTGDPKFPLKTRPAVRDCNWEQWKNYYSEEDSSASIDALIAGYDLQHEIALEQLRRYKGFRLVADDLQYLSSQLERNLKPEERILQRIRVKSPVVLRALGKCLNRPWAKEPITFFRPFRTFVHFYEDMRNDLQRLEEKMAEVPEAVAKGDVAMFSRWLGLDMLNPADGLTITEAHADFKFFLDYVKDKIRPLYQQYDFQESPAMKVRFDDLFNLFRPGEYIYVPEPKPKSKNQADKGSVGFGDFDDHDIFSPFDLRNFLRPQRQERQPEPETTAPPKTTATLSTSPFRNVWRLFYNCPPRPKYEISPISIMTGGVAVPLDPHRDDHCEFNCYYIDYDGESYGPVEKEFRIPYFKGEKDIRSLPIFPLRYADNREEVFQQLQQRGKMFAKHMETGHLSYRGWTLTTDDNGEELQDEKQNPIKHPEHIDSDVIVDFAEAFVANPVWKPAIERKSVMDIDPQVSTSEDFPLNMWSDANRTELVWSVDETLCIDDYIDSLERNEYIEKDTLIREGAALEELTGDCLVLLPRRVFAYTLRERKFVHADIHYLESIRKNANAFEYLKIDAATKRTVLGLVHSHFEKKKVERLAMEAVDAARQEQKGKNGGIISNEKPPGLELISQDFIRGKGLGLVILLHGRPGVGKTATAEAAASVMNKPLFTITMGDLGFTPEMVEKSLTEIFRLAHQWNCVLLLDEADVFLSQRLPNDLERNALVSVFLRVLEYYQGILFLTTNRPGILDEAVTSRVHVSLYYPKLGREETIQVFEINLNRLEKIEQQRHFLMPDKPKLFIFRKEILDFAATHFDSHTDDAGRWNGRQIRNAFQIASSLAHYDSVENEGSQPQLHAKHFELVAEAVTSFDNFRTQTLGKSDSGMAYTRNERYDQFDPAASTKTPTRRDSSHPSTFTPPVRGGYNQQAPPGPATPQPDRHLQDHRGHVAFSNDVRTYSRASPSPSPVPTAPAQGTFVSSGYGGTPPQVAGYPPSYQQQVQQPVSQPQWPQNQIRNQGFPQQQFVNGQTQSQPQQQQQQQQQQSQQSQQQTYQMQSQGQVNQQTYQAQATTSGHEWMSSQGQNTIGQGNFGIPTLSQSPL